MTRRLTKTEQIEHLRNELNVVNLRYAAALKEQEILRAKLTNSLKEERARIANACGQLVESIAKIISPEVF